MARTEVVAMILAGGQGSRLGVLTKTVAKPAVPFGSRYRIIDFPLSNCVNSGIEIVGVLTQYQPLALNTYVGNGHPWDLDRNNAGAYILPPFQSNAGSDWYKGTANAIYQNMLLSSQATTSTRWITPQCSRLILRRMQMLRSRYMRYRGMKLRDSASLIQRKTTLSKSSKRSPQIRRAISLRWVFTSSHGAF